MSSTRFPVARAFIDRYDRFAIFTHLSPDGDALGSAYALCELLTQIGKRARVILLESPPITYDFEQFRPLYVLLENADMAEFDASIAVDCADYKRLSDAGPAFASHPSLSIDHHLSNTVFAQANCVRESPATAQVIYELYMDMHLVPSYVARMGIYMGIVTDTGSLTYPSTTARSFEICAKLKKDGLDTSTIAERVTHMRSLAATKLIARFVRRMMLFDDNRIAVSYIMHSDLMNLDATAADTESLVNYGRDIDTVEVAIFLREFAKETFKVSFRSKEYVDVAQIAARHGGGGHARAAGCVINGWRDEIIDQIVHEVEEAL